MANFEPMPFRRQFGASVEEKPQCSSKTMEESPFIDVSGATVVRAIVTGACRKCGYVGHLAYQCRNFLQPKEANPVLDISSTSSESDYETPLVSKDVTKKRKKEKKKHKKREKKEKHKKHEERKRKSKDKVQKHERKKKRKRSESEEKERKKRKRKYHNSSSSKSPTNSSPN